ncbi:MAG TPA: NAD(P)-dependent oxidoreductase [Vineibacter sp.]|nr:NAD(P)-dependent oxidoreductase [Vineibacter sp.]
MPSTIFIDATPDLLHLWRQVLRDTDPAIAINMVPVAADQVPAILADHDTCIVDATYFPKEQLERCRNLRHIVFLGTGAASYIDLAAARDLGIKVSTISGYGDTTVAEHAIGLMFAAARQTARMDRAMRAGAWTPSGGMQLFGKTLGVVGLGGIGREMARLGRGIGMDVLAWNRTAIADPPVPLVELDALLQRADVVSLHLSLNDTTRGFMNRDRLRRMKPGAILINTARGAIIDQAALVDSLASGHIRHAAIDVFEPEPPLPGDPLLALETVTLSAHAGFFTPEATMVMLRRSIDLATAGY